MPDQPTDWSGYQIDVDPSVPNPLTGRPTAEKPVSAPGTAPQLTSLGGPQRITPRRTISLVAAVLAAVALAAGLLLNWSEPSSLSDRLQPTPVTLLEACPAECLILIVGGMLSLALIFAHRWRYLVTCLNVASALTLWSAVTSATEGMSTLSDLQKAHSVYHLGPAWLPLSVSILLSLVASLVQPPRQA
jgi:hypothetical protein